MMPFFQIFRLTIFIYIYVRIVGPQLKKERKKERKKKEREKEIKRYRERKVI
jgi:hypothetical protein